MRKSSHNSPTNTSILPALGPNYGYDSLPHEVQHRQQRRLIYWLFCRRQITQYDFRAVAECTPSGGLYLYDK